MAESDIVPKRHVFVSIVGREIEKKLEKYLLIVIFKGTCEYLPIISGGLKELTEEICFRKNSRHHLNLHVRISHVPHI